MGKENGTENVIMKEDQQKGLMVVGGAQKTEAMEGYIMFAYNNTTAAKARHNY